MALGLACCPRRRTPRTTRPRKCSLGPSQLSGSLSSLRFVPDLGPLFASQKDHFLKWNFRSCKTEVTFPTARFRKRNFVADGWNCHRNQSASPDCPVGGLSPRFSYAPAGTVHYYSAVHIHKRCRSSAIMSA